MGTIEMNPGLLMRTNIQSFLGVANIMHLLGKRSVSGNGVKMLGTIENGQWLAEIVDPNHFGADEYDSGPDFQDTL